MISSTAFEPGAMYVNAFGQLREIVSMDGLYLVYRLRGRGTRNAGPNLPKVGELRQITKKRFSRWATREVA